jgi:hypothetical protein
MEEITLVSAQQANKLTVGIEGGAGAMGTIPPSKTRVQQIVITYIWASDVIK